MICSSTHPIIIWSYNVQLSPLIALAHLQESLPQSAFQWQLLGLNLLCLLSQNRVAEFHTELERLPANEIQNNVYIK